MKLFRYGPPGLEKPGIIDASGGLRDLSGVVPDIGPATLTDEALASIRAVDPASLPAVTGTPRLGACVGNVGKLICIGLNYVDHAQETGMPIPAEPIMFMKVNSAICGPDDDTIQPRGSTKLDWEVELAVVIGKQALYVDEASALDHVAGYTICNDVSERAFQLEGTGQWTKGKSCDTFGPLGPWMVTRDEVPDPQNLDLWLEVNGKRFQDGNTKTMIFGVAKLVSYCSQHMTLYPGDVISTGTPPGVGAGLKPPMFLEPGDRVRLGIQGLGEQNQLVVADSR